MCEPHVRRIVKLLSFRTFAVRLGLSLVLWGSAAPLGQAQEQSLASDAVVYIKAGYEKDGVFVKVSEASGFLVSQDGWIITSKHLTEVAVPDSYARVFRAAVGSRTIETTEVFETPGPVVSSDVALLRFSPAINRRWPFLKILSGASATLSEPIEAYGFPLGQEFTARPGAITALIGPKGTMQVNAGLAPGMSGGPVVLGGTECVIGIVAGGSGFPSFDFVTPVQAARSLLDQASATYARKLEPENRAETTFERSFQVDETRDDHGGSSSSRVYEKRFDAEADAEIVSARFEATSEAHSSDRNFVVSGDRKSATLHFRLESGPLFDQYRGWLHGKAILEERRRPSTTAGSADTCR